MVFIVDTTCVVVVTVVATMLFTPSSGLSGKHPHVVEETAKGENV